MDQYQRLRFDNIVALKLGEWHFYMPDKCAKAECPMHADQYAEESN